MLSPKLLSSELIGATAGATTDGAVLERVILALDEDLMTGGALGKVEVGTERIAKSSEVAKERFLGTGRKCS